MLIRLSKKSETKKLSLFTQNNSIEHASTHLNLIVCVEEKSSANSVAKIPEKAAAHFYITRY